MEQFRVGLHHIVVKELFQLKWSCDLCQGTIHKIAGLFPLVAKHIVDGFPQGTFDLFESHSVPLEVELGLCLKLDILFEV